MGSEPINVAAFEEAAGVGVEVSAEQITAAVKEVVEENKERLLEERWAHWISVVVFCF